MLVKRASTAGFCMGVGIALRKLESALARLRENAADMKGCDRICTLGPIIHNPQVLAKFASLGVACLEEAGAARPGDYVLIRAHGVPLGEEAMLASCCAHVEDATCPKVKKAQMAIAKATQAGAALLLFGESEHPEVRGLISYARGNSHVFASRADLDKLSIDSHMSYVLASQTTQDREIFEELAACLAARLPRLKILSTICDATRQRQNEALAIAAEVEAMVVVGGMESGNTRRLANLSRQAGVDTFHVETVKGLNSVDFRGKSIVGLTAGASTPASEIDAAERWLSQLAFK